ncbi:MAG: NAD(P)-dependent glycerol-3-phosphate dehydrogenase [Chlamydiales bacterium]|nr:NAD(P)-dependent glycerol-3-phosphate dehydrogenase [Chlamydiales bacterium]
MKKLKIAYLGSGAWGYCLANLLAGNGHQVTLWGIETDVLDYIKQKKEHPKFPGFKTEDLLTTSHSLRDTIRGVDMMVESVTTKGIRPVLTQLLTLGGFRCPFVFTSKGIEQKTGLLLPEIALEVLGEEYRSRIGCLSGPSIAQEVMQKMPTSVVAAAFDLDVSKLIADAFSSSFFRVYPNEDVFGVAFGGAMKNAVAIASGICDGLGFGDNTKAAMITRGLHEMRKLSVVKNAKPETINGLSGLGDLCVTCLSVMSRNYKFGRMIAEGVPSEKAKQTIGMVVEGENTCVSAMELSRKYHIPIPITEAVYKVLYEHMSPQDAVRSLLAREVKEEQL